MKLSMLKHIILALVLGAAGTSYAGSDSGNSADKTAYTAATELNWVKSGFGPDVSPVHGDFTKEAHITYVKFPAGMATPIHTHTHDYVGLVITGVSMHWEPGKPETKKKLSAGAHWFMPANVKHVSECFPGVECVMAIFQKSAMDFLPMQ